MIILLSWKIWLNNESFTQLKKSKIHRRRQPLQGSLYGSKSTPSNEKANICQGMVGNASTSSSAANILQSSKHRLQQTGAVEKPGNSSTGASKTPVAGTSTTSTSAIPAAKVSQLPSGRVGGLLFKTSEVRSDGSLNPDWM